MLSVLRRKRSHPEIEGPESAVGRMVRAILSKAAEENASGVLMIPGPDRVEVRFQVGDVWQEQMTVPPYLGTPFARCLKGMAGFSVFDEPLRQEGRILFKHGQQDYDIHIAFLPTRHGQRIEMSLLRQ